MTTHDKTLKFHLSVLQPFDDFNRDLRAVPAEHDEGRRQIRIKTESFALHAAIRWVVDIEIRFQDHAGHLENSLWRVAYCASLPNGPATTADNKLILLFQPEMRWIISEVRHYGDIRHIGMNVP